MAEPQPPDEITDQPKAPQMTYWRSRQSGMSILFPPKDGDVTPERFQFQPYEERYEGEPIKVGYFKTNDPRVIARLKADNACEKINQEEYNKCTDAENNPKVKLLPL